MTDPDDARQDVQPAEQRIEGELSEIPSVYIPPGLSRRVWPASRGRRKFPLRLYRAEGRDASLSERSIGHAGHAGFSAPTR